MTGFLLGKYIICLGIQNSQKANTKDYKIIIDFFFKKVLLTLYYKLNLYSVYWHSKYELEPHVLSQSELFWQGKYQILSLQVTDYYENSRSYNFN